MVLAGPAEADRPGAEERIGPLIGRPRWAWFETRRWGPRRVGVAAVIVIYATLGTLNALTVPPLVPRDETGHVSYAVSITHARLPTIHTPLPKDDVPALRTNVRDTIWVANHPPLFYVLAAGPMKVALWLDRPTLGIRLIRLMNVGFMMVTMALAAVLGRRLLPRSPRAPIVAAAATGLIPTVPHITALAYNDSVAMATATALVVAAVAVFDRGPSTRLLAWVAATASAAALTRFTNLAVVAAAGVVVLAGVLRHTAGPFSQKARAVGRSAAIVGIPLLLSSAWFYIRNRRLYGDFTGAHDLLEMFNRRSSGTVGTYLGSGGFWRHVHDDLWTRYARARSAATYGHGWPLDLGRALSVVFVFGLLCALGRWIWVRRGDGQRRARSPDLVLAAVAVGEIALFVLMMAQFQTGGGSAHSRYLFPVLPVIACFVALAWAALPGNRRGVLSAATLIATVALSGDLLHRLLVVLVGDTGWIGTEIDALSDSVPAAAAVYMVALLVLGVALGIATWALLILPPEQLLRRAPNASAGSPADPTDSPPPEHPGRSEPTRPVTVAPPVPLTWPA